MKYTREHGVVRARIDCANPDAIPIRLDHFYDGEGFAIYFDIEAPDGSIIPTTQMDLDNADGEGGDGENENRKNESKKKGTDNTKELSNVESSIPEAPAKEPNSASKDKPSEMVHNLQVGSINLHWNPSHELNSLSPKSVPPKSWFDIVEEEEAEIARSALQPIVKEKKDVTSAVLSGAADVLVGSVLGHKSMPNVSPKLKRSVQSKVIPAAAENSRVSLPRQAASEEHRQAASEEHRQGSPSMAEKARRSLPR
jgi:hypothetical protein